MIVLQGKALEKFFGSHNVFHNVSLTLRSREKIALTGVNGSGKSTLLKVLTGQLEADGGEVAKASGIKFGYLEQMQAELNGKTLWQTAMQSFEPLLIKRTQMQELERQIALGGQELEKNLEQYARLSDSYEREGGYLCETRARKVLMGLGFREDDFEQLAENLSGGQKTRLRLACTLIQEPDVLILDEPTNHLDIQAVEWLESYLKSYNGTLLLVSHDRMLLEQVATGVWEMRRGQLQCYQGNYPSYLEQKALHDLTLRNAWEKQQIYIQKTEEYIRTYKAGIKSKQARGRASVLSRLERLDAPQEEKTIRRDHIDMNQESGRDVVIAEAVSKAYRTDRPVLQEISLHIRKGEKVALIGPNGCGKSTFLKILAGRLAADSGSVHIGSRVEAAWFSQEFEELHDNWTLFEEISRNFDLDDVEVRSALGSMLFSEDDAFKRIETLSGGEKGRLALLKLMLTGANFLLLDEPTNHLDLESREIMERILREYPGTLLVVSHDRYFIDQIAGRVVSFEVGGLVDFPGNYSYYKEKMEQRRLETPAAESAKKAMGNSAKQREEQKQQQRARKKLEQRNQQLETEIAQLEAEKSSWEERLAQPEQALSADYSAMAAAYRQLCETLDARMEEWTTVQLELEESEK